MGNGFNEMAVVLPDIPRLFTALAEWCACVIMLQTMKQRYSGWKRVGSYALALFVQAGFLMLTDQAERWLWVACMLAAFLLMVGFVVWAAQISLKEAAYHTCMAFMAAEFAASIEWQLYCFVIYGGMQDSLLLRYGMLIVIYMTLFLIMWKISNHLNSGGCDLKITSRELSTMAAIVLIFFILSNLGFTNITTPFNGRYSVEIFNVRTLVDLGGLGVASAYHLQWMDNRLRSEYAAIQSILHNQYAQFKQSEKSLEIINYKYHDLKHHIIALRAEEDAKKREEYLDKMEEEIRTYEAQNKTGNKVLDVLLTTKSLYCQKKKIQLTCVLDGTLLSFMDVMDICSIFGNALDNAIESVKKVEDEEKRLIHATMFAKNQLLIVRFENYFEGAIHFENGIPATTKEQSEIHGYGIKSIRYTVHKYGGEVDISTEDHWFYLKIVIPLPGE